MEFFIAVIILTPFLLRKLFPFTNNFNIIDYTELLIEAFIIGLISFYQISTFKNRTGRTLTDTFGLGYKYANISL
ncbi:MAG: hypothetical protein BI182_02355 [Acetobacterium sp. MES1]|nr:MAG: hypothetical protein BI182_02355 [Acetobacterium sp. MES1]